MSGFATLLETAAKPPKLEWCTTHHSALSKLPTTKRKTPSTRSGQFFSALLGGNLSFFCPLSPVLPISSVNPHHAH